MPWMPFCLRRHTTSKEPWGSFGTHLSKKLARHSIGKIRFIRYFAWCCSLHCLYLVVDAFCFSCWYMAVVSYDYVCPMRHYRARHFHQFSGLPYPIRHNRFNFVIVNLLPDLFGLFFEIVCLRQGLVHIQRVVKPCLILLVEDLLSIAQQQVSCAFQHLASIDVFFHAV